MTIPTIVYPVLWGHTSSFAVFSVQSCRSLYAVGLSLAKITICEYFMNFKLSCTVNFTSSCEEFMYLTYFWYAGYLSYRLLVCVYYCSLCNRQCHRRVDIYYSTNYNKCKFTLAPDKLPVFAACCLLESACYFVVIRTVTTLCN